MTSRPLLLVLLLVAGALTAARSAVLATRRVRDYLPFRLATVVLTAVVLLAGLLATTTALGSTDDMGRAGRTLFRQCTALTGEGRGPWPGSFYSLPLAAVVGLGLVVAAVALRSVVRRPRQGSDLAADDQLRRRAAETVTAAAGLLVVVPFAGVAFFAGIALNGTSCAPAGWRVLATALLLAVPVLLAVGAWCAGVLLGSTQPAAVRP